jgi:hypothetical protein
MAIQIRADGTWSAEYEGPFSGLDTMHPETMISDKASPSLSNFMLRNAELRSWPAFVVQYPGVTGGVLFQLGISSFFDINGVYHVVTWADVNLYQFNPALLPASPWVGMVGAPANMEINTVSYRTFANSIYYTVVPEFNSIVRPFLAYWDGLAATPVFTQTFSDASVSLSIAGISLTDSPTVGGSLPGGPTIIGPMAIGGMYLGELNNQLILANVWVRDQGNGKLYNYNNLIWWSANGLPLQWDPTQNTSAGFNAFLDVPDQITGFATLGIAGYIFRTNGITQMTPTGSAIIPWEFDHMWASDHGIGNVLPFSIAQYGPTAVFVAEDNVYSLSVTNAQPIGGTARDSIYTDIAKCLAQGGNMRPYASIVPKYKSGYIYLTYNLLIPFLGFIRMYVYSFEDKNWSIRDLPVPTINVNLAQLYCSPNVV